MKIFAILFSALALNASGQTHTEFPEKPGRAYNVPDTVTVTYEKSEANPVAGLPVWYIDSIPMGQSKPIFNIDDIENISVKKDGKTGMIYIATKKPEQHNFMTLEAIKAKYIKTALPVAIYMVDNEIIKDISYYKIDEKYILNIKILASGDLPYLKEEKKFTIINIITRSKENIKKASVIYIRGTEPEKYQQFF